jgi:hypothetical protein
MYIDSAPGVGAGSAWEFSEVILITAIGGAFGGFVEMLSSIKLTDGQFKIWNELLRWSKFWRLVLIQFLLGICGAMAVIFVFSSTTWFPQNDTTQTKLWLLTLSVVAGFGARRFLPIVTKRLEAKINDLEDKIDREREDTALNFQKDHIRAAVSRALAVLAPNVVTTKTEIHAQLLELQEILTKYPTERSVVIVAGRLCRTNEEWNEAISLHSTFIAHKEKRGELDVDYADVLYNRACYRCKSGGPNPPQNTLERGLKDIELSVKFSPTNLNAVHEDDDFSNWRENEAFKNLISTFASTAQSRP